MRVKSKGEDVTKIEVGEYGRTNKGKIFIFAWLENSDGKRYTNKVLLGNGKIFENKFYYFDDGEEIVKHSKNIIDLIEVGDYVNGVYIDELPRNPDYKILWHTSKYGDDDQAFEEKDIKSIVTHEQFSSIEYKVGENK